MEDHSTEGCDFLRVRSIMLAEVWPWSCRSKKLKPLVAELAREGMEAAAFLTYVNRELPGLTQLFLQKANWWS
jgi:hypothetical protein